jgi:hypothetical protein
MGHFAGRLSISLALAAAALSPAAAAAPAKPFDLNGDGRQDLVVGTPEAEGTDGEALAALFVRGSRTKTLGSASRLTVAGLGGDPKQAYSRAGTAVASGDFDADGFADLAVGVPSHYRNEPEFRLIGAVAIVYGGTGFPGSRRAFIEGPSGEHAAFGAALAAGDLDRDGFADLVVGAPGDDADVEFDEVQGSGALHILFGGSDGLDGSRTRVIGRANRDDQAFGEMAALGDIDRDGDLDVFEAWDGAPRWTDDPPTPGHLTMARGGPDGPAVAEWVRGEFRGGPTSLAVGDVTGDGYQDLVAGIGTNDYVGEDEPVPDGAVMIWPGSASGPGRQPITITQDTRGIPGSGQQGDRFGEAVAVARIDRDRFADIVVGAPGEDAARGRVTVIRGGRSGHAAKGHYALAPGVHGLAGKRRGSTAFGGQLALLDHTGDGRLDLSIGVIDGRFRPNARLRPAITVVPGKRGGFATRRSAKFRLASFGVKTSNAPFVLGRPGGS